MMPKKDFPFLNRIGDFVRVPFIKDIAEIKDMVYIDDCFLVPRLACYGIVGERGNNWLLKKIKDE